jgi:hypothetical protein
MVKLSRPDLPMSAHPAKAIRGMISGVHSAEAVMGDDRPQRS